METNTQNTGDRGGNEDRITTTDDAWGQSVKKEQKRKNKKRKKLETKT